MFFVADGYGYTLDLFNKDFKVNAPLYHTMGNHDYDPFMTGDIPGLSTGCISTARRTIHSTVEALTSSLSTIWYIRKERPLKPTNSTGLQKILPQ